MLIMSGTGAVSEYLGFGWATPGYFCLVLYGGEPADVLVINSW